MHKIVPMHWKLLDVAARVAQSSDHRENSSRAVLRRAAGTRSRWVWNSPFSDIFEIRGRPFFRHFIGDGWVASFYLTTRSCSPLRIRGDVEKAENDLTFVYLKYL